MVQHSPASNPSHGGVIYGRGYPILPLCWCGVMTSKKHYIAIANEFAELLKDLEGSNTAINAIVRLADRLACIFKADNPAFDRDRFMQACGADPVLTKLRIYAPTAEG